MKSLLLVPYSLCVIIGCTAQVSSVDIISIGSRLEPFVDEALIERMTGVELMLHQAIPREVALVHDAPWEGNICCYHTVFQDGPLYRMYYRGAHWDGRVRHEVICYAESPDGIHWHKPSLGLCEFRGSRQNNIVWNGLGAHCFTVFKDENPKAPASQRYKAFATGQLLRPKRIVAMVSADGLRWRPMRPEAVLVQEDMDSGADLAFWDPVRKHYVAYIRGWRKAQPGEEAIGAPNRLEGNRGGYRQVLRSMSVDFLHWSPLEFATYESGPLQHYYTNGIRPYFRAPHVYFGIPKRFVPNRTYSGNRMPGLSDGVFMSSRDGKSFRRWGEAVIRPGPQRERWVNRNNMAAWGMVETESALAGAPSELSIYSTEGYYQGESCQIRRHSLRLDGFVSAHAASQGGELVTRPLTFTGEQLRMNFATSAAGGVRVELQDPEGQPVPGYSLDECPEIYGDAVDQVVRWKAGANVAPLAQRPVRIRFALQDADLYSFRFGSR